MLVYYTCILHLYTTMLHLYTMLVYYACTLWKVEGEPGINCFSEPSYTPQGYRPDWEHSWNSLHSGHVLWQILSWTYAGWGRGNQQCRKYGCPRVGAHIQHEPWWKWVVILPIKLRLFIPDPNLHKWVSKTCVFPMHCNSNSRHLYTTLV